MALIKALGKALVFAVVVYLGFRYLGDFPSRQSAVLALAGFLLHGIYKDIYALLRPTETFTPFEVSILPNWYVLLSDLKLVGGMEEWQRLYDAANKVPTSEYNVVRDGIDFTVIRPPFGGWLPGLTYWDDRKVFVNKVELAESIIRLDGELDLVGLEDEQHPFFRHPKRMGLPQMYFRPGQGGYELGLEVDLDWWEELCKSGKMGELAKVTQDKDHRCGTTRLAIATLPYSEFAHYYQKFDYSRWEKERGLNEKQLAAKGWKRKEYVEIRVPWSQVEHKYFTLCHREI